jgi:uncharacterized protein
MDDKDKRLLLKLARDSIKTYFSGQKPELKEAKHLSQKMGIFVTLHDKRGKLRGCIGYPTPAYPLYLAVVEAARSAAFHDPRFPPVVEEELESLDIEISLLTAPALIMITHYNDYMKAISIGTDGLIIEGQGRSGLLLPQVATENDFNAQNFLNCLCQKAGMGFNDWKDPSNKIYKFQAEVFSEKTLRP